jgi:hypothetical protein
MHLSLLKNVRLFLILLYKLSLLQTFPHEKVAHDIIFQLFKRLFTACWNVANIGFGKKRKKRSNIVNDDIYLLFYNYFMISKLYVAVYTRIQLTT